MHLGAEGHAGPDSDTPAGASASAEPAPAVNVNLHGGQGNLIGDHNIQYNTFVTQVPRSPNRIVAGNVPQEPPAWQPRADLMAKLRACGPGIALVRAVTGMRGVGKTQLAAAFARECVAAGWRVVAWVNAETITETLNGLAVVAVRLSLGRPDEDLTEIAAAVRNHLEADGNRCLLVFDNVADLQDIRPYLPSSGGCQVVITSLLTASAAAGTPVMVDVYTAEESHAFLTERTGLPAALAGEDFATAAANALDEPTALAEELGHLPLALAQAASVIVAQRLSYSLYLTRLRALALSEYLIPGEADPYPRGTAQTIILSLDAVSMAGDPDLCAAIMSLISLLSPAGVSRSLLHRAGPGVTASAVDAALGHLASRSLLSFSQDGGTVTSHRLVTRVVRERQARDGTLPASAALACTVLDEAQGVLDDPWENRSAVRDWIQHVITLADSTFPYLNAQHADVTRHLLALRGKALELFADLDDSFAQAVELGEPIVADHLRILGSLHPDTLIAQTSLAYAYQAVGRLAEATGLAEAVLAGRKQVLGDLDPETLASRNNLAYVYRAGGRIAEAIPLFEMVLADRVRLLGESHPDTLVSRTNLAHAYQLTGRVSEAILLGETVLAQRERALGESHPQTLTAQNNLARAYETAGRAAEAIVLYESALAGFEQSLGTDHPRTAHVRKNLERAKAEA